MSALGSLYFKKETLETLLKTVNAKGDKGVEITFSINDESNKFGQNVSSYVSQTKEQREAKKERFFVANGNVFWTDGVIKKSVKSDEVVQDAVVVVDDEDLPF